MLRLSFCSGQDLRLIDFIQFKGLASKAQILPERSEAATADRYCHREATLRNRAWRFFLVMLRRIRKREIARGTTRRSSSQVIQLAQLSARNL